MRYRSFLSEIGNLFLKFLDVHNLFLSTFAVGPILLQQRHPLGLDISTAADDAVQVYAAGHAGAREVGAVPYRLIESFSLHLIHLEPNPMTDLRSTGF